MAQDVCPLPSRPDDTEQEIIRRMLSAKRIAVYGASDDPARPAHYVPAAVQSRGVTIVPVNPKHQEVLGEKCYRTLAEVPPPIDLVNVFRRAKFCPQVVLDAIAAGAKGIWLQSGIISPEARKIAAEAGIDYIEDRCLMMEFARRG